MHPRVRRASCDCHLITGGPNRNLNRSARSDDTPNTKRPMNPRTAWLSATATSSGPQTHPFLRLGAVGCCPESRNTYDKSVRSV